MQSEADTLVNFRREFLWRFSKYRLDETDLRWADGHLPELRRMSVDPMFGVLRYVWNHLRTNTDALAERHPELAPLAEALGRYCEFHRQAHEWTIAAQDELLTSLAAAGVWPLAIKGCAMRTYTATSQAMTDLDLLARDLDETWEVAAVAERLGYGLDKIKVRRVGRRVPGQEYHGYANLYRCADAPQYVQGHWDLGRVRTLDLHFGRFYGPGEGVLVTDLWRRASRRRAADQQTLVPAPEDMVLVEVLHLVRHGTLSMGTVNRLCQLFTEHELDDRYLSAELRANDLEPMTHAVLGAIATTFPHARARVRQLGGRLQPPGWLAPAVRQVRDMRRVERYGAGSLGSVSLQAHYLLATERRQRGRPAPVGTLLAGFGRMYRNRKVYPRAHTRWQQRRLGWVSESQPAVMLRRIDRTAWQPVANWSAAVPDGAVRIGGRTLLVDRGQPTEAVLTPVGAFAATRYDGQLSAEQTAACLARVGALRAELPTDHGSGRSAG